MSLTKRPYDSRIPQVRVGRCCASCKFCHVEWPLDDERYFHCCKNEDGTDSPPPRGPASIYEVDTKEYWEWKRYRETNPKWDCDFYVEGECSCWQEGNEDDEASKEHDP
jgi:hypothetical protein